MSVFPPVSKVIKQTYKNSSYAARHEEFSLVAGIDEISNFEMLKDLAEVVDFLTT